MKAGGLGISCWKKSGQVVENKGGDFGSVAGDREEGNCSRSDRWSARADSFVREIASWF